MLKSFRERYFLKWTVDGGISLFNKEVQIEHWYQVTCIFFHIILSKRISCCLTLMH